MPHKRLKLFKTVKIDTPKMKETEVSVDIIFTVLVKNDRNKATRRVFVLKFEIKFKHIYTLSVLEFLSRIWIILVIIHVILNRFCIMTNSWCFRNWGILFEHMFQLGKRHLVGTRVVGAIFWIWVRAENIEKHLLFLISKNILWDRPHFKSVKGDFLPLDGRPGSIRTDKHLIILGFTKLSLVFRILVSESWARRLRGLLELEASTIIHTHTGQMLVQSATALFSVDKILHEYIWKIVN